MNLQSSSYRHTDPRQLMQETLKHLADAQEFYRHAARSVIDAEVRNAFAFSAKAHAGLLESLQQAAPLMLQPQPLPGEAAALPARSEFAVVAGSFDGRQPQASAEALNAIDSQLLRRLEALFANYPDMHVRAALKRHVRTLQRAGDATRRLALRNVA